MNNFGLVHLKAEGAPIHPDDVVCGISSEMTDERFFSQLKAYYKFHGKVIFDEYCSRPNLLKDLQLS